MDIKRWEPTVLVLGAGGVKGYMMVGTLLFLEKTNILKNIKKIVGVSIGAIIGILYVIGCSMTEILELTLTTNVTDVFSSFDMSVVPSANGIFPHQVFRKKLTDKLIEKFGFIPTFKQLYLMTGYEFICTVANLDDEIEEHFSHITEPDLLVTEGVLMSMNIPIFFHMYKYKEKLYVDGGVMNTLPFDKYDDGKTDILTISLGETYIDPQKSLLNYLLKVVKLLTNKESQKILEMKSDRNRIIKLRDDTREPIGLQLNFEKRVKMVINGYINAFQFLENLTEEFPNQYKIDIKNIIPINYFELNK